MKRLVQAQMTQARWFHCNYTPIVDEYMQVTTISSCYPMLIIISYIGMRDTTEEILIWATSDPIIVIAASTICRIMDDIVGNEVRTRYQLFSPIFGEFYIDFTINKWNQCFLWDSYKILLFIKKMH